MDARKVDAGKGFSWTTGAVELIFKNPLVFLTMGLIFAVIGIVPILGSLALLVIGPALLGGIVYAAREQAAGRPADIAQLFQAFKEPGKIGPMLLLCLPSIGGGIILFVLAIIFVGGALLGGGATAIANGSSAALLAGLGGGLLVFLPLALFVGLVVYALQFFAIPRVMLDGAEPFDAMKESLRICRENIGAYLLFVVGMLVIAIVLSTVLMWLGFIGALLVSTVLSPLIGVGLYLAWHDVLAETASAEPVLPPQV